MRVLIFSFIFSCMNFAQSGNWQIIQTKVTANLKQIYAVDSLNIWVAGDSGYILYTSDTGNSWQIQNYNPGFEINDIFFINSQYGWAVENGADGIDVINNILHTNDGGQTWNSKRFRPDNVIIYSICFVDTINGVVAGNQVFAYTTDNGLNWIEVQRDSATFSNFPVRKVRFVNDTAGFAVGGLFDRGGVIWHSYDKGFSWITDSAYADPFFDMVVMDSVSVLTIASDIERSFPSAVFRTSDLGQSWFYEELPFYGVSTGIDKRTSYEIWGTFGNEFIFSSDAGNSWLTIESPDSILVNDLTFVDSIRGFAVTEGGKFLKYIFKVSSVSEKVVNFSEGLILYQNYPNPFNAKTKIRIDLMTDSYLNLTVYNSLGEVAREIFKGYLKGGTYEFDFDASSFPSGIYPYVVKTSNALSDYFFENKLSGKMILMK